MQKFPRRLEELLKDNQGLHSAVLSSVYAFYDWLCDNKTPFFPEYTDHSLKHLNEVVFSADSLISDSSWEQLTPEDAAALIISILLHDCAMHLSEDGFYQLINNDSKYVESSYIENNSSWKALWLDFMAEAKRFDGKRLFQLFGDDQPVSDIPVNKIDLTMRDKLLIGEFLRRHHARLAHEIAISGVPGSGKDRLKLIGFESKYLDLFGFIARSHNMELRESVDHLEFSKRRLHYNVHVPFVMLLLRVADYIQIHSERAPNNLLKIKGLLSPISRSEWNKHYAIEDINNASEDPEALYVEANPQCAYDFESLKLLFSDIQKELDKSWAVLGETYGRVEGSKLLGIKIRRIRSNLDNVAEFIKRKQPSYVPKLLKMKTADSEMMELLVAPLYGKDPSIGVRELVQNSVDACIELKDLEAQGLLQEEKSSFRGVTVKVCKDNEEGGRLVIEDYGIGMNIEIVEKYFLNIGASFRNSDLWKKNHENDGKSNVYRTGRFGIGFLAAYLLGDNIKVTTRRVNESINSGLTFQCKKGEPIEVTSCSFRHGTKIEIDLDKDVVEKLLLNERDWDWFCLREPEVKRSIIDEEEVFLEQNISLHNQDEIPESNAWNEIEVNGFENVFWSYSKIKGRRSAGYYYRPEKDFGLICNGIFVNSGWDSIGGKSNDSNLNLSSDSGYFNAKMPTLVVFDQDGRLPLNLQRTGLSGENPFVSELKSSVSTKFVENIVEDFSGWFDKRFNKEVIEKLLTTSLKNVASGFFGESHISALAVCEEGFLPVDFNLMKDAGIQCFFTEVTNSKSGLWSCEEFKKYNFPYLPINYNLQSKSRKIIYLRKFLGSLTYPYMSDFLYGFPVVGRKLLIKKEDASDLFKVGQVPKFIWGQLNIEWENEKWVLYDFGGNPKINMNLGSICDHLDVSGSFGFIVNYFDWFKEKSEKKESPFYKAWKSVVHKTYP